MAPDRGVLTVDHHGSPTWPRAPVLLTGGCAWRTATSRWAVLPRSCCTAALLSTRCKDLSSSNNPSSPPGKRWIRSPVLEEPWSGPTRGIPRGKCRPAGGWPGTVAARGCAFGYHLAPSILIYCCVYYLRIPAGQTVGAGRGPAQGKDHCALLVARFYATGRGSVLIDGKPTCGIGARTAAIRGVLVNPELPVHPGRSRNNIELGQPVVAAGRRSPPPRRHRRRRPSSPPPWPAATTPRSSLAAGACFPRSISISSRSHLVFLSAPLAFLVVRTRRPRCSPCRRACRARLLTNPGRRTALISRTGCPRLRSPPDSGAGDERRARS